MAPEAVAAPEITVRVEAFLMQLGPALHRLGTPADLLEAALGRVASHFCVPAHFLCTPTSILASFGTGATRRLFLLRGDQGEANLGRLSQLERLSEAVIAGDVELEDASVSIDAILAAPPIFSFWYVIGAYGLCSVAVARLIGGGWREMAAGGLIGLMLGALGPWMGRRPALARLQTLMMAVASALCACFVATLVGPMSVRTATLAGLIILVPGLSTTTALTELATGNLVAGTSRLMGAVVTFLQLGFGVAFGAHAGRLLFAPTIEPLGHVVAWTEWPALALAAMSLAVLLQAELRDFGWILLCALLGLCGLRYGGIWAGQQLSPLCAAFAVTLSANWYARTWRRPASVLQVPAMLLLVPGSIGYRSVAALMDRDVIQGMQTGFIMAVDTVALVAGALLASLLLPPHKDL